MPRTVIFANGELTNLAAARQALRPDDYLIASDGGAHHCRTLGLYPQVVIGDFDSLTPEELKALQDAGSQIIKYPVRKDQTDLELALAYAIKQKADDIFILGALGGRWDQTLANLLLLAHPALNSACIHVLDGTQHIYLIQKETTIEGQPGDTVSLIPVQGDAWGITTQGLEYPLTNGTLPFGSTLGISNVLVGNQATVEVREGMVICVVIARENLVHGSHGKDG
jgi:thiamine pyrophosphokinase